MTAAGRGKTKAVVEVAKAGADLNLQDSVRHISMCCYTNDIQVGVELSIIQYAQPYEVCVAI